MSFFIMFLSGFVYGSPYSKQHPSVALLATPGHKSGHCTAILIAPTQVITASDCLMDDHTQEFEDWEFVNSVRAWVFFPQVGIFPETYVFIEGVKKVEGHIAFLTLTQPVLRPSARIHYAPFQRAANYTIHRANVRVWDIEVCAVHATAAQFSRFPGGIIMHSIDYDAMYRGAAVFDDGNNLLGVVYGGEVRQHDSSLFITDGVPTMRRARSWIEYAKECFFSIQRYPGYPPPPYTP